VSSQQEPDKTSMAVLASDLFLERMSPPGPSNPYEDDDDDDDDDAQYVSTVPDRIDGLDDLSHYCWYLWRIIIMVRASEQQQQILSQLTPPAVKDMIMSSFGPMKKRLLALQRVKPRMRSKRTRL